MAAAKKPIRTILGTIAVVLVLAAVGFNLPPRARDSIAAFPEDSPAQCVARLLDAERAGDMQAYLDCFTTPQQDRLRTTWHDAPSSRIAGELQSASAGLAGHALTDQKRITETQASLVLERIYKDHTARQTIVMRLSEGCWRIAELSSGDWQTPAIRYGSPVSGAQ